jgi:ABC-2 type transport system permease protein
MNKFWLVFRYEYLRHVRRKRFIFALLSLPLMVVLMIGAIFLAVWADYDSRPVGYVDLSGVLANAQSVPQTSGDLFPDPQFVRYADETTARSELDQKKIQGYYVLLPEYMNNGSARFVTDTQVKDATETAFKNFLRYNLVSNQPAEIANRLVKGPDLEVRSLGGTQHMGGNEIVAIIFPMVIGVLFLLVINTSGSYLVGALIEEKENRTMEIVVTSISTDQLMAGKVVGNLAVGLTELVVWVIFGLLALSFMANVPSIGELNLDAGYLWLSFFILLPAFVMVAGFMATAGATAAEAREAQQIAGLFTLPVVIPFWLVVPLMESPNSPLSVALSLFPLTAPISMAIRAAFTNVPVWQTIVCLAVLYVGAIGAIWLASRAFRLSMLRYGKRLSLREIFKRTQ